MICLQFAWFEVRSCNIQDLDYLLHILLQLHGKVEIFIKYSIYSQRKPPDFMKKPVVYLQFAHPYLSFTRLWPVLLKISLVTLNCCLSCSRSMGCPKTQRFRRSASEFWHCSETHQAVLKLGSISGIWARAPPLEPTSSREGGKTEHERSAEIEPMHNSAIFGCLRDKKIWGKLLKKVWTRYQHMTTMENNCFWMPFT